MSIKTDTNSVATYTVRRERRRGFQPPWYTVQIYTCACGRETCLRVRGSGLPPGAILCDCGQRLSLGAP